MAIETLPEASLPVTRPFRVKFGFLTSTPIIAVVDFLWHGKRVSARGGLLLCLACAGVAAATVSDVQLNARGACLALASVLTGIAQKMLNEHLQQRGGLSSLQLMQLAFPPMTLIGLALVPAMDPPGVLDALSRVAADADALMSLGASALAAICINVSTTLVLGATSALSLVLLGQVKTCSVLLAGALLFDAVPTTRAATGSAMAVASIGVFAYLKVAGLERQRGERKVESAPLLRDGAPASITAYAA